MPGRPLFTRDSWAAIVRLASAKLLPIGLETKKNAVRGRPIQKRLVCLMVVNNQPSYGYFAVRCERAHDSLRTNGRFTSM